MEQFDFQIWLKELIQAAGGNKSELARQAGLSVGHFNNLTTGEREPTDDSLRALAKVAKVDPDWLIAQVDASKKDFQERMARILAHAPELVRIEGEKVFVGDTEVFLDGSNEPGAVATVWRMVLREAAKQREAVVLVDEPEVHIHPGAILRPETPPPAPKVNLSKKADAAAKGRAAADLVKKQGRGPRKGTLPKPDGRRLQDRIGAGDGTEINE